MRKVITTRLKTILIKTSARFVINTSKVLQCLIKGNGTIIDAVIMKGDKEPCAYPTCCLALLSGAVRVFEEIHT